MSLIIPLSKGSPTKALPIANSTRPQAASRPRLWPDRLLIDREGVLKERLGLSKCCRWP